MRALFLLLCLPLACLGQVFSFRDLAFMQPRGNVPPITASLGGFWELDSAQNTDRVDSTGNGNTLYYYSGTIDVNGDCIFTNSCYFHLSTPGLTNVSANFNMTTGTSKSFSGWFLTTTVSFGQVVLSQWDRLGDDRSYALLYGGPNLVFYARKGDNSADITVTSTIVPVAGKWYFFACGYDAANNQIWIKVDDETRVTAACPTVRTRSTCEFRLGAAREWSGGTTFGMDGLVDEVGMWNRYLTDGDIAFLNAEQNYPGLVANSAGVASTSRFVASITGAGGAAPSAASSNAVVAYINQSVASSVHQKNRGFLPILPDNLIASVTGFQRYGRGVGGVVNHNFLLADLSVNGLTGNGSTKYLELPNITSTFASPTSIGLGYYLYATNGVGSYTDLGATTSFNPLTFLRAAYNNHVNSYLGDVVNNVIDVVTPGPGFFTAQRTSSTVHKLYFAKSTSPFAQLGATDTVAWNGTFNNQKFNFFAYNANGATGEYSVHTLSFLIFTTGMSSTEASAEYDAIQAFRTTLGGGFR